MLIIKLNAIDSTNSYLRQLCNEKVIEDYTVVTANHQTQGRGQMGTIWDSEKGKNLMCSVFTNSVNIPIEQQFYISIATSLALIKTLQAFNVPKLNVKWPNDILAENKKICGILIENVIKHQEIEGTIIGIGLNVNQISFKNLPNASSMKELTGVVFNLDELLQAIVSNLKFYFNLLLKGKYSKLKKEYERYLFRKGKPSTFKLETNQIFPGFIEGVNEQGKLIIRLEDDVLKTFDLKEIQLLY
jgi:BirA family biotin operon repressor/biotin-[acetyl-CoA-carboxylase] ligase